MKNFQKGFTLIELLVVVAIIGILASVVLASLNSARKKGADAAIKANLNTVLKQAELFYSNNNFSYLPSGGSNFSIATCPTYDPSGTNMFSKDPTIANAILEAIKNGQSGASTPNRCYNSATHWVVAVKMNSKTDGTNFDSWCIDSTGASKIEVGFSGISSGVNGPINNSPYSCK